MAALLLLCFILALGFCAVSECQADNEVDFDGEKVPGSGDFCKDSNSGSDCKIKDEGCFYYKHLGVCAACKHKDKVPKKYSVAGCGLSTLAIVGIVFGVLAGVLLIILAVTLAICFSWSACPLNKLCCQKQRQERLASNTSDESGSTNE